MTIQFITTPSGERMVVVPESEWLALQEALEDKEDLAAIERFERRLTEGEEEFIPSEIVDRLLSDENKVRVWREYRGLTEAMLAEKAGVTSAELRAVESNMEAASLAQVARIADALNLSVDDLI